jgi:hypothetical protein
MKKISPPRLRLTRAECVPDHEGAIADWQLIAMAHYEYARCSRTFVEEVNTIRERSSSKNKTTTPTRSFLPLANYLARQFPEFPKTPWAKIAPHHRMERLKQIGIDEKNGLYQPARAAWECWPFSELQTVVEEEDTLEIASENFGVFKIDFSQNDPVIEQQFSNWLKSRRTALQRKYDSTGKLASGITSNRNHRFRGRPPEKRIKGGGAPPKKYRLALTALGRLRAFVHTERIVPIANKLGDERDLSSWEKYEFYAGRMMSCMESVWKCGAVIIDVFSKENFRHNVGFTNFKRPPIRLSEPRKGKIPGVRKFLSENFIISELNYEPVTKWP